MSEVHYEFKADNLSLGKQMKSGVSRNLFVSSKSDMQESDTTNMDASRRLFAEPS